jgi:hypothetical protein
MFETIIGAEVLVGCMVFVAAILTIQARVANRLFRVLSALVVVLIAGLMMMSIVHSRFLNQLYSPIVWLGLVAVVGIPLVFAVIRLLFTVPDAQSSDE